MRAFNSTIKIKLKSCKRCGVPSRIFSRGRCQQCAKIEDAAIADEKENDKEESESLQNLVEDLDTIFSRYIRLKYANEKGLVQCFTCPKELPIAAIQNGHYVHRTDMATRFLEANCRPQCPQCNSKHNDDPTIFRDRLENETAGITSWLREQSREIVKPTRDELKSLIIDYRYKVRLLEKKIKKA